MYVYHMGLSLKTRSYRKNKNAQDARSEEAQLARHNGCSIKISYLILNIYFSKFNYQFGQRIGLEDRYRQALDLEEKRHVMSSALARFKEARYILLFIFFLLQEKKQTYLITNNKKKIKKKRKEIYERDDLEPLQLSLHL